MYYIIEIQQTNDVPAILTQTAETKNEALSKFHLIMASAALSSVEYHTCVVMDEQGKYLERECFIHAAPEPEPETAEPEVTEGE